MYLLFDIGGTKTRIGISSDGQKIDQTKIIPTAQNFAEALRNFKEAADHLSNSQKIEFVAGGIAGPIDKEKTRLVASPHLKQWINQPLKDRLEKMFAAPVILEHEADLEGLGEVAFGAGQGYQIVATIIIGTGIATTRIVNGRIDENALGFEAGHHIIILGGDPCDCGGKGHFEAYVSGSTLIKKYGKKGEEIQNPKVWDDMARYVAIGLNNVTVFWSPDIIVLGGSLMKSISLESVRKYFKEDLTIFPTPPEILPAQLGELSALFGALKYTKNQSASA